MILKARGKGLMIRKNRVVLYLECSTLVGHYVVHVFILPLFPSFFTPPLPLSSISHQVSHREYFYLCNYTVDRCGMY